LNVSIPQIIKHFAFAAADEAYTLHTVHKIKLEKFNMPSAPHMLPPPPQ
jgi:hypothetical protein